MKQTQCSHITEAWFFCYSTLLLCWKTCIPI